MRAIILAAGRGSRMQDLTDERPKCLLELDGKALIDIQISALRQAGVNELGIVTGYRRELLVDRGLTEFHNARWAETNMLSSLACADEWLSESPCLVSYSDIFYDVAAPRSLVESDEDIAITYDLNWQQLWERRFGDPLLDAETFRLSTDGAVREIGEKPESLDEIEGQYMGLLRFTPKSWSIVQAIRAGLGEQERDSMHLTGLLQRMIHEGNTRVAAISYQGPWGEVDTPEDLAVYRAG